MRIKDHLLSSARGLRLVAALIFGLSALLLAACKGGGSDVGPQFRGGEGRLLVGSVLDAQGRPIHSAQVRMGLQTSATDASGRFHLNHPGAGVQKLEIDGRYGAVAGGAQAFAGYSFELEVDSAREDLDRPIYLPDLGSGGSARLPIGAVLGPGTSVVDARTGARLLLDGVTLGFRDPLLRAGETEVDVHLSVLDSNRLPVAIASSTSAPLQNGAVAIIEPLDLVMDGARLVLSNDLQLPGATPGVLVFGLGAASGRWRNLGTATVSAGEVDTGAVLFEAGLITYARQCPSGDTTVVRGLVLDPEGNPFSECLVCAGARSVRPDQEGRYALAGVCARDGAGAPLALTVHFESNRLRRPFSLEVPVIAVPGGDTLVPDQTILAPEVSAVSVLVVYRGENVAGVGVSLGNMSMKGRRALTARDGVARFFDVPLGRYSSVQAHLRGTTDPRDLFAEFRHFHMNTAGALRERRLFLDQGRLKARKLDGTANARVVVRGTAAPVEEAFALNGLDGSRRSRRDFTRQLGAVTFTKAGKHFGIFTAGYQSEAPSSEAGIDLVRQISYKTIYGVDSRTVVLDLRMARDAGGRVGGPAFGVAEGDVQGLSDPALAPPQNLRYQAQVRGHRAAFLQELAVDLLGIEDEPSVLRADLPLRDSTASFGAPDFSVALDPGPVRVMVLERDLDASGSGPVVRAGLSDPLTIPAGGGVRVDPVLSSAPGGTITLAALNLDAALLGGTPLLEFGWRDERGQGFWGGDLRNFTYTPALSQLELNLPPAPPELGGGDALFVRWQGIGVVGESYAQSAFLRDPLGATAIELLDIPRILQPAPGGVLEPSGSGIVFQNDLNSDNLRLRLMRSETVLEGSKVVRIDYEWEVDVAAQVSQVIFPSLPDRVGSRTVPAFFKSGTYEVELLTWRGRLMDFDERAAFRDRLLEWEQDPVASSLYRSRLVIP